MMDSEIVQRVIDVLGAKWVARDNPVSRAAMSSDGIAYLGLRITSEALEREKSLSEQTEPRMMLLSPPPPRVDWRNNGGAFVTDVKNQSACGSCVAFATCAMLEARARITRRDPGLAIDLSEAHLFSCGCGHCCDTGWFNDAALAFAQKKGVGDEQAFPYRPGNQPCPSPQPAAILKVTSFSAVSILENRKRTIASKGPVTASMEVYDDFRSYSSGIYSHVTGSLVGYHAVCVVGYDDADGCWIVKNSWDSHWGENGFFRIAYGQCGIDSRFAFYDADVRMVTPRSRTGKGQKHRPSREGEAHA